MVAGVWQILNRVTGACLLGGSVEASRQLTCMATILSSNTRPDWIHSVLGLNSPLSIDWRTYGKDKFTLRVIEKTARHKSAISPRKLFWCRVLQPKYDRYQYDPIVSGVYQIFNVKTGYSYIGQSRDIFHRWGQHKSHLRCNRHGNKHLQDSFNKGTEEDFELRIIDVFLPDSKILIDSEKSWIKRSQQLFNIKV